jgi:hypothetical protein
MKILSIRLLFRGSENGWSPYQFHRHCDNQGPTITIMRSKAGKVFGGFTRQSWESLDECLKEDEKTFLFSVDLQKTYKVAASSKAIYCNEPWGPSFGGYALALTTDPMNLELGGRA